MRVRAVGHFGAMARQRRRGLGLSQGALAERAGVTRQWLVRFEHGNAEVALSKAFAVLAELDLVIRVDPAGSASDPMPRLVIPNIPVSELRANEARLSTVREAIQLLDAETPGRAS